MRSVSNQKDKSIDDATSSSTVNLPTTGARGGSYFASDSLRLILHSAATQDLHAIQGVSRQFKRLAEEELQSRSGLIYQPDDKTADIFQVRILFDSKKQIAVEARSKKLKLPILLPIRDKQADLSKGNDEFHFLENPLHIQCIVFPTNRNKPMMIQFSNGTASLSEQSSSSTTDGLTSLALPSSISPRYSANSGASLSSSSSAMLASSSKSREPLLLKYTPFAEAVVYAPTEKELKLIEAVNKNDSKTVATLLGESKEPVSPNIRDREGVPMLVLASYHGDIQNVRLLVSHRANLEARSAKGVGQLNAVLTAACYIDEKEEQPENKELVSVKHENKHKEVMIFLIEQGARIDVQSRTGKNLLHYLASQHFDNTKEIRYLLGKGANPAQVDLYDRRPAENEWTSENIGKNLDILYCATMNTDPALYCTHWSLEEKSAAYSIHFKPGIWTTQKATVFEAICNKLKSLKTEEKDPKYPKGLGIANDTMTVYFPGRSNQSADVTIPDCSIYAVHSIEYNEEKNCLTFNIRSSFRDNTFVHRAIRQAFVEDLKLLPSNLELMPTPSLPASEEKKDSHFKGTPVTFKPASTSSSSTDTDEENSCCLGRNKTTKSKCVIM